MRASTSSPQIVTLYTEDHFIQEKNDYLLIHQANAALRRKEKILNRSTTYHNNNDEEETVTLENVIWNTI